MYNFKDLLNLVCQINFAHKLLILFSQVLFLLPVFLYKVELKIKDSFYWLQKAPIVWFPTPTGLFFIYCLNKILPSWRTIILSVKTSQSSLYSLRISQNTIWKLPDTINFIKIRVLPEEVSSIVHSVKVLPLLQKVHLSHDRVDTFLYGGGCLCSRTCKLIHATTLRCPCKS